MGLPQVLTRRDVSKEVGALLENTKSLARGSVVDYETIKKLTKLQRGDKGWSALIRQWKRRMMSEFGMWVGVVNCVGYRLLTVDEQLKVQPERYERQARKRLQKAVACAGTIPAELLNEHELRFQAIRIQQSAELLGVQDSQIKSRKSWLAAPESLPRIESK